MFLTQLSDNSKQAFLDLALICAKADGKFSSEEQEALQIYSDEMGIEKPSKTLRADYLVDAYKSDFNKYEAEISEILDQIYGEEDLIIVYFELFAMIYADNSVSEIEKDIITRLKNNSRTNSMNLSILENSARALATQMDMLKFIRKDM